MSLPCPPLLPCTSPRLAVAPATAEQLRLHLTSCAQLWGLALPTAEAFVQHLDHILAFPAARGSKPSAWVLTGDTGAGHVYSSCVTHRRHALAAWPDGSVVEGAVNSISMVWTLPELRCRGYAARMLQELGERLSQHEGVAWKGPAGATPEQNRVSSAKPVLCSNLFSSIGEYYARVGWVPFANRQLEYNCEAQPSSAGAELPAVTPLSLSDIGALCGRDSVLQAARLSQPTPDSTRIRFAVVPDQELLARSIEADLLGISHLFPNRAPASCGALWTSPGSATRVWALWARQYFGAVGLDDDDNNCAAAPPENLTNILRFVIDDEAGDVGESELAKVYEAIMRTALDEAKAWKTSRLLFWDPPARVKALAERANLHVEFSDVEGGLPCMMWYGDGEGGPRAIDWTENSHYAHC